MHRVRAVRSHRHLARISERNLSHAHHRIAPRPRLLQVHHGADGVPQVSRRSRGLLAREPHAPGASRGVHRRGASCARSSTTCGASASTTASSTISGERTSTESGCSGRAISSSFAASSFLRTSSRKWTEASASSSEPSWSEAIYWETVALSIVNELYNRSLMKPLSRFERGPRLRAGEDAARGEDPGAAGKAGDLLHRLRDPASIQPRLAALRGSDARRGDAGAVPRDFLDGVGDAPRPRSDGHFGPRAHHGDVGDHARLRRSHPRVPQPRPPGLVGPLRLGPLRRRDRHLRLGVLLPRHGRRTRPAPGRAFATTPAIRSSSARRRSASTRDTGSIRGRSS